MPGEVTLTRAALDFILHAARNTYPEEFVGLLRKNKRGEIAEVLVIPQAVYGTNFSSINLYNVPYTSGHCGSIHSHPGMSARPSRGDLAFFRVTGEVHLIVCYPYDENCVHAYGTDGKELALKLAEP